MKYAECKRCGSIPKTLTDKNDIKSVMFCEYCGQMLEEINIDVKTYFELSEMAAYSFISPLILFMGKRLHVVI